MPTDAAMRTVEGAAAYLSVTTPTVLALIKNRELRAVNLARSAKAKRPRWRISQAALDEFLIARTAAPPIPRVARRPKWNGDIVEFYRT